MFYKLCKKCKEWLPYTKFQYEKRKTHFLGVLLGSTCYTCRKEIAKIRRERKHLLLLQEKSKPCKDCGIQYPWYVMDFDHLDPSIKKCNISNFVQGNYSDETILSEISKCDLVCANCHRARTYRMFVEKKKWHPREQQLLQLQVQ